MHSSTKRKKILTLIITGMLVLVFVTVGLFSHAGKQQLKQRLQTLRDQGYPTKLSDLEDVSTTAYDTNNAAPLYIDALTHFSSDSSDLAQFEMDLPIPHQALDESRQKQIQDILSDNQDILAILHNAAQMENCDHPIDPAMGDYSPSVPLLSGTDLIRLLSLEIFNHSEQNNPTTTFKSIEAAIGFIRFFNKPFLIHYMIMNIGQTHITRSLHRVLNRVSLTEPQLEHLSVALESWLTSDALAQTLAAVRCRMLYEMQQASRHSKAIYLWSGLGFLARDMVQYIDLMQAEIDITHLPTHQQLEASERCSGSLKKFQSPFLKPIVPKFHGFFKKHLNVLAQTRLAHTAIAIERYQLATGNQPETLEQLIPLYIISLPQDPFTGSPMQYQSSQEGYCLSYDDANSLTSRKPKELIFTVHRE